MTGFRRKSIDMEGYTPLKLNKRSIARYEIVVMGRIDPEWANWFGEIPVVIEPDCQGKSLTCLTCQVHGQSELFVVLDKLYSLNFSIYSIRLLSLKHLVQRQPVGPHVGLGFLER